jgi:hypothetical protein
LGLTITVVNNPLLVLLKISTEVLCLFESAIGKQSFDHLHLTFPQQRLSLFESLQ